MQTKAVVRNSSPELEAWVDLCERWKDHVVENVNSREAWQIFVRVDSQADPASILCLLNVALEVLLVEA